MRKREIVRKLVFVVGNLWKSEGEGVNEFERNVVDECVAMLNVQQSEWGWCDLIVRGEISSEELRKRLFILFPMKVHDCHFLVEEQKNEECMKEDVMQE